MGTVDSNDQEGLEQLNANAMAGRTVSYTDNLAPSQLPPGNLNPGVVPQFVTIGFDDNQRSDGMDWIVNFMENKYNHAGAGNPLTYDGTKAKVNFYLTGDYAYGANITAWYNAYSKGHEIGNHTQTHAFALPGTLDLTTWRSEIERCNNTLVSVVNIPRDSIKGYRSPFLQPSNSTMEALKLNGFTYDCSLEEGFQPDHDGTNYFWPYTLNNGSPGNDYLAAKSRKNPIGSHNGLWEMGIRALIIPPDELCEKYKVAPGLRAKIAGQYTADPYGQFEESTGKLTALDYSIWVSAKMTAAEALATLKYTFDLRMQGNRAPFLLGAHTDEYSSSYTAAPNASYEQRRATIEAFINYVLGHPEVRLVSMQDIVKWMKNPEPIVGATPRHLIDTSVVAHVSSTPGETAPAWDPSKVYTSGMKAEYNGKIWQAKWWNQNQAPGTANAPWDYVAEANVVTTEYWGKISPEADQLVKEGETPEFFFYPDPGCTIKDVVIDGVSKGPIPSYKFPPVTAAHTIVVEFQK